MVFLKLQEFYRWWIKNHCPSDYVPFCPLSKGLNKTIWRYCDKEVVTCPYADDMGNECYTCKDKFVCFTMKWDKVDNEQT